MRLSYLLKECTPLWRRMMEPESDPGQDPDITSIHSRAQDVRPGGLFIAIKGFKVDGHDYIEEAVARGASAVIAEAGKAVIARGGEAVMAEAGKAVMAGGGEAVIAESGKAVMARGGEAVIAESGKAVIARGGDAVIPGESLEKKFLHTVMVEVKDTRKAMSSISHHFYGTPSGEMAVVGITGTNGKTTTTWILESILRTAGHKVGVIGTINYRYMGKSFENPVTTPESIDLHRILSDMRDAGITHVIMEVSSHAMDLHRVRDCQFKTAVFTNLTRDHLDYHKTMGAYFACKKRLFTGLGARGGDNFSVINVDDAHGRKLAGILPRETVIETTKNCQISCEGSTRGHGNSLSGGSISASNTVPASNTIPASSIISASNIEDTITGISGLLHINGKALPFLSGLTGGFNLDNILSAAGAAHALAVEPEAIVEGIGACGGVPGRLERVENRSGRHIFVDYAHTPDALESILRTLRMRAPARLITIFGCGGDRDTTKRAPMGEIAAAYSDLLIVTSDNPRSEDPHDIIEDIMAGVRRVSSDKTVSQTDNTSSIDDLSWENLPPEKRFQEIIVQADRKKALEIGVALSREGDIIVAAGKGHETYQIIKTGKIDFDDRLVLENAARKFDDSRLVLENAARKFDDSRVSLPIPWSVRDVKKALTNQEPEEMKSEEMESEGMELEGTKLEEMKSEGMKSEDFPLFSSISTDSRTIGENDLFVALKGEKFDAHSFIPDLIEAGVRGFVVEKGFIDTKVSGKGHPYKCTAGKWTGFINTKVAGKDILLFPVNDTLEALGMLARYHRIRAGVRVVGVTGSNGKTSTREMITKIFEQSFSTLSTTGNLNNEIGLPLTLLRLSKNHSWAVVEMGMNHPGEISRLSKIAMPDIAVVTNTAAAHLEGMDSVINVARAKGEITHGMTQGSTLILNCDDPRADIIHGIARENRNIKEIICFGTENNTKGVPAGESEPRVPKLSRETDLVTQGIYGSKKPDITAIDIESGDFDTSFTLILPSREKQTFPGGINAVPGGTNAAIGGANTAPGGTNAAPGGTNAVPGGTNAAIGGANEATTGTLEARITLHSPAPFMIHNALAASACALAAGIPAHKIECGLAMFKPVTGRMNIITRGNLHIIDDTYNANPASVKGALRTLERMAANISGRISKPGNQKNLERMAANISGRSSNSGNDKNLEKMTPNGKSPAIAVLGDMLELGENAPELHQEVGREAAAAGVSRLYLFGDMGREVRHGALEGGLSPGDIL
ncbi:MAG: UDP-N-acetylmuramyl-tripeptide synthetase, partial [Desulfamplus sp.]|nr:UDP-N-acetylmuramyl-tripeptide synthetase [Desulfamplus sp.]